MSTFVGYLGNLINLSLGVPFGAGQFMAGLHVFWLILIRAMVPRTGVGTIGGTLKGLVELFTGSTHGIVILFVSLFQGFLIDIVGRFAGDYHSKGVTSRLIWWIGAGIASASNVIIFQIFYFSGVPILYISVITLLAFCSGVIFAGYFAWETIEFLGETGVVPSKPITQIHPVKSRTGLAKSNLPAIAFILFLITGSLYYIIGVARYSSDLHSCQITGLVEQPFIFSPTDFTNDIVTIEAQLSGSIVQLPPTNYTGVLLTTILQQAKVLPAATGVRIVAWDGYVIALDLNLVLDDAELLLTDTLEGLWLIAGNYEGSFWVQKVSVIEIY